MKKSIIILICAASFSCLLETALSQCYEYFGYSPDGGHYNAGAFYKTDINGNVIILKDLLKYEGYWPMADLCEADNHKLYGVVNVGGNYNEGYIFEWDLQTKVFNKKIDFAGDSTGKYVRSKLLNASNGKLYGMTNAGGNYDLGVLFEYDPVSNIFRRILDFDGPEKGSKPNGSLIQSGNGKLYGMTTEGGANNCGVIFEYDPELSIFKKLYDFIAECGKSPHGSLFELNHKFYGMTRYGGSTNQGVIFEYDSDLNKYTKRIEFTGDNGKNPEESLIAGENGMLYGMTPMGGKEGSGVLFEWNPTTNEYSVLYDFYLYFPTGTLLKTSEGIYLGRTWSYIFEWVPATDTLIRKAGLPGSYKSKGGLMQATNGMIYGTSQDGGIPNIYQNFTYGTLFEFDPVDDTLEVRIRFQDAPEGAFPNSMVRANNGKFYGTTKKGGKDNFGALYEFDPYEGHYFKLVDFYPHTQGVFPLNLINSKSGQLFGYSKGDLEVIEEWSLFGFNPESKIFTLYMVGSIYFQGMSVRYPNSLIEGDTNAFYFSFESGEIYKWIAGENKFSDTLVVGSNATIFDYKNGRIYGTYNTPEKQNILFEIDAESLEIINSQSVGTNFYISSLIAGDNQKIYGLAREHETGILWEWDPRENIFTRKIQVDIGNTSHIFGNLQEDDDVIYGYILLNETEKHYAYFECDPNHELYNKVFDMKWPSTGYPDGVPLRLKKSITSATVANTCDLYVSPSGKMLTESGIYYDTIPNYCGCDSVISINLTVNHNSSSMIDTTAFESYISPSGKLWSVSGSYSDTIPNFSGCDSIITVNLTLEESTGIKSLHSSDIRIYPNPGHGSFSIDIGNGFPGASLVISDINGKVLRNYKILDSPTTYISTGLCAGVYIGTVHYGNNFTVIRILIE